MAKELPYFKFYCSEWTDGDITLEGYEVQGLYINICSWYWSRECRITIEQLKKKFSAEADIIDYLVEINLLKNKNGKISISFLDEQLKQRKKVCNRNRMNGLKGGRPKTQSVSSGLAKTNPNKTNIEEKRREEKRRDNNKDANAFEVISYLNEKTGKSFKTAPGLKTRFKEGYTVDDCKKVIDIKCAEWAGTEQEKYLRPQTLFSNKFDSYVNQEPEKKYTDLPYIEEIKVYYDTPNMLVYNENGTISTEYKIDPKYKCVVAI